MTTVTSPGNSTLPGSADALLAARRAEAAAMRAAEFASEAYATTQPEDEAGDPAPRLDRVLPVTPGRPRDPLVKAVADFGVACHAAARATHLAAEFGPRHALTSLPAAADAAARAVRLGVDALLAEGGPDAAAAADQLAHAAAVAAHLAADTLTGFGPNRRGWFDTHGHPTVSFPVSWQWQIDGLTDRLSLLDAPSGAWSVEAPAGSRDALARAALAARNGATNARRAYAACPMDDATARAAARLARIVTLATCYAGNAALDALSAGG